MLAFASTADAFLIDDFMDDQVVTAETETKSSDLPSSATTSFLGTNRRLTVTNLSGQTVANINRLQAEILDMSNSTSASGIVALIYSGIGGVDFTQGGTNTGLYLGLPSPIQEPMTIAFDVDGSLYQRTFLDGSEGNRFFFPFLDFSDPNRFGSVNQLTMTMTSLNDGWDASIDSLETRPTPAVPVPGTLALLALGLGLVRIARDKRG